MIHLGSCLEIMPAMPANSFDSIVTDPPYHLTTGRKGGTGVASLNLATPAGRARIGTGFMGKEWDGGDIAHRPETWAEVLRVAKPGAFLVAFGGTRTYHRLACAIEDAGWELRDTLMWLYGSGFPKSHNGEWGGTALKPAWEPIVLARKPLAGTVEANWRLHGTGALNIEGCRIEGDKPDTSNHRGGIPCRNDEGTPRAPRTRDAAESDAALGRWPANVLHDGSAEVLAAFPEAPGQAANVTGNEPAAAGFTGAVAFGMGGARTPSRVRGDSGSAARFFYCAKADRADRNDGCEGMPLGMTLAANGAENAVDGIRGSLSKPRENIHPTVKPTDLMRWLCRLVTPAGGLILDPFAGSGSTGRGAIAEGFRFEGIELSPEYAAIAEARIRAMQPGLAF